MSPEAAGKAYVRADAPVVATAFGRLIRSATSWGGRVFARQVPFAMVFTISLITLPFPSAPVTSGPAIVASVLLVALSLLLAWRLPWDRWPEWASDSVMILQFIGLGALRFGTGGAPSAFAAMVYLLVVVLAAQRGLHGIVVGVVGATLFVGGVVSFEPGSFRNGASGARAVVAALTSIVIALYVHEIVEVLRRRNEALEELRARQDELLASEHRHAEQLTRLADARERSHQQMVSIIDAATEQSIVATDVNGVIEVFNAGAERLTGYAQSEVVGRMNIARLHVHDELVARWAELHGEPAPPGASDELLFDAIVPPQVLAAGADVRDWTLTRRDGTTARIRLAATARTGLDGTPIGYVVVASDVTEDRETERLRDEFVGMISHELRTPLTSVLGYLELLQDGVDPLTDDQREYLTVIERNAHRQLRLVSDLLMQAQMDAGTFAVSPSSIDLADVVRASVQAATPVAAKIGVTLVPDITSAPVQADSERVGQVVDNIIANAIKFTSNQGQVHVTCRAEGEEVVVSVRDTGAGVSPDEVQHIFERFFRTEDTRRRSVPGVGLGLSIARGVAAAHGGTLTFDSALGEGSRVTMRLPRTPPSPSPTAGGAAG